MDASGWNFTADTQYLTSGIVPINDQSWSMIGRFSNVIFQETAPVLRTFTIAGVVDGDGKDFAMFAFSFFDLMFFRNGGSLSVSPTLTSGVIAVAGSSAYINGVKQAGSIGAPSGNITGAIHFGKMPAGYGGVGKIQAVSIYSTTLSDGDVTALYTKMAAL